MGRKPSIASVSALSLSLVAAQTQDLHYALSKRNTAAVQQVHIPGLAALGMTAYVERPVAFADASNEVGELIEQS